MSKLTIPRVNGWIRDRLLDDADIQNLVERRIYRRSIPEGAAYPLIVFQMQSSIPLLGIGGTRVWGDLLYVIKVIGQSDTYDNSELVPIVDRIDSLFHRATGTFDDQAMWECIHEEEIEYDDEEGYCHLGTVYRVKAQYG